MRDSETKAQYSRMADAYDKLAQGQDDMMPGGMNGVELAREIQKRRSDIPILLTSGYSGAAIHEAKETGVNILSKPYRIEELAVALNAVKSQRTLSPRYLRKG